ncbi:MAG TPA: glycoside hydrolase [Nitrospirae bacterium]|nr:hypothetical protein BMS3Abin10_02516 [bacterium BMS3Abin10]GBE39444.1 hypothetical protein BMS3Bbin08_02067 [bacterium BMS3Bbin08]HDH00552.1 glycoside hydrolase [Nitrospirota bacterium]HDH50577.1 glycoside hydrolase [Nitrospirota bacterium]HDK81397.1 glycoside hydrolase [Nitrospirota bacterium]
MRTKQKKKQKPAKKTGIKKQLKTDPPSCRVTFTMPREAAQDAREVVVVGDFNKWNINTTPMKKQKNGDFEVTVELPCNTEYSFKYLINPHDWPNPACSSGKCIPDSFICED